MLSAQKEPAPPFARNSSAAHSLRIGEEADVLAQRAQIDLRYRSLSVARPPCASSCLLCGLSVRAAPVSVVFLFLRYIARLRNVAALSIRWRRLLP